MNRFSRVRHHVSVEDVKKKHLEKIAVENFIRTEEEISKTISEKFKRNWRRELEEGMTTANTLSTVLPAEGDTAIDQVSPIDAASFADVNNMFGSGADNPALDGATIRANGSGSGDNGGFNVGGNYLAFQGDGSGGSRMALLSPMDATKVDTLTITAIRGNDSNGGEDPDVVGQEELFVIYKTPEMSRSSYLSQDRSQNNIGSFPADAAIIAIGQGDGTLQDYTITIPEYARQKDTVFGLFQLSHSGTGYDHYGVTDIKFQRKTPLNVVVSLDSPEAISFVRVGTDEGDPKKRKKKVNDQLKASDEYTTKQMGGEFPGQGARLGDEASSAGAPDPFSSASIQEPEASPIGKDAVTKAFTKFSAQAASAEPEVEPKDPSTQATLQPKDEDGEEIKVKPVGDIGVQGADAAKLEAEAEVEPEIEPTSIEEPEPEPSSEDDDEDKQKSNAEKAIKFVGDLLDEMSYSAFDVKGGKNIFDIAQHFFSTAMSGIAKYMFGLLPGPVGEMYRSTDWSKMSNNISIARAVMGGKVVNHVPLQRDIAMFRNSLTPEMFKITSDTYIPISSMRHEYADDNIYVYKGKVYNNRGGEATNLTVNPNTGKKYGLYPKVFGPKDEAGDAKGGLGGHGSGYAQLIIPEDGGKPYVHYYDYNYHNLKNPDDLPVGAAGRAVTGFASDMAHFFGLLNKVPGMHDPALRAQKAFNEKFKNLGNEESFIGEGWPPGIHGAALTDFKVPLDALPEETQKMIANHPLSWTDERVANMSDQYLSDQFDILLEKDGVKYNSADQGDSYIEGIIKIMNSRDINIDPKFKESFIGSIGIYDEMDEVEENRQEVIDSAEYNLATKKAYEDYQSLRTDKEDAISDENLKKEVPDPTGDFPKFDMKNDPKIVELDKQHKEAYKSYNDYYNKEYSSAWRVYKSHADTLKERDGILIGTDEEIAKLKFLGKKLTSSKNELDRLSSKWYSVIDQQKQASTDYLNKITKQREPWTKAEEKRKARREELSKQYDELIDQAYTQYESTFQMINLGDGKLGLYDGGDYTDPSGKTYAGKGTLTNPFDLEMEELEKKSEQYNETLKKFGFRYMTGTISQYLVNKQFTGKVKDWTPGKKGTGNIKGGYKSDGAQSNQSFGGFGGSTGATTSASSTDAATLASNRRRRGRRGAMTASRKMEGTPLFEKLKTRGFFNPKDIKPTFPENDPPEIDKKTGMHPDYGKQAKRYRKLDPMSANAMPSTGDPEIDAVVDQQRTKKKPAERKKEYIKTVSKIKKMAKRG